LRLIRSMLATAETSEMDSIANRCNELVITDSNENARFCHSAHGRPFKHDTGQIVFMNMHGSFTLACSSSDAHFFVPALETLDRSTLPPHPGCTLSEDSWRLSKAFLGDLSKWRQQGPNVLVKGDLQIDETGQLPKSRSFSDYLEMEWLNRPFSSYLVRHKPS
jgi:hypothetical protein